MPLLATLFGDANKRFLNKLADQVRFANGFEAAVSALSDGDLRAKTEDFRERIRAEDAKNADECASLQRQLRETVSEDDKNELRKKLMASRNRPLDALLPEAFAVVREAARRTLGQRHFDVQFMGGMVLHQGQVAEMKTGEGKTLTSTLAVYLNALLGRGVHVITVNDYLARRDAVWMGQIYDSLGLSIGVIVHEASYLYDPSQITPEEETQQDAGVVVAMDFLRNVSRREAYRADVTYGTNNEFGFDYLRDNMVMRNEDKVQRELHYAIIDEVDSILIDEARTPLIISAPDEESTDRYYQFAKLVETLVENQHYNVDEKMRAVTLTEEGIAAVEKVLGIGNIYVEQGIQTVHHIEQALRAKTLFFKDKDYTVKDGEVIIVDEFTGRMLPGRRYSEGLHQAIEAKEGLKIQRESKTMATVTFQNYFRMYEKLAGMTGTAETEAEELVKIYALEVTTIPTNKAMIRADMPDRIYKTQESKFKSVVQEIKALHEKGQPVLVGTISIEKNEYLAQLLSQEGLTFNILNAKNHEREAEIIAQAGSRGAITVATNMAGRGVDIKLGGSLHDPEKFAEVVNTGGLHVLGTERHESRRIDNQLRGRSGRQGEPGSSQFYVSLEDDLMRIFGADRVKNFMSRGWPDDMPIENRLISKSIESAQKRVEGHNFDIRKHLVEYDDVINKHRTIIYQRRNQVLAASGEKPEELVVLGLDAVKEELEDVVYFHTQADAVRDWDVKEVIENVRAVVGISEREKADIDSLVRSGTDARELRGKLIEYVVTLAAQRFEHLGMHIREQIPAPDGVKDAFAEIVKILYLRSIDMLWVEHLDAINYLRTGIGLRGYGQRDPLVEYKRESRDMFNRLLITIRKQFANSIFKIAIGAPSSRTDEARPKLQERKADVAAFSGQEKNQARQPVTEKPKNDAGIKIGRNDPCFCGAVNPVTGEPYKYKKCGLIHAPYHLQ